MVFVYGKESCQKCHSAKEKLQKMGVDYVDQNIDDKTGYHDGWRELQSPDWYSRVLMYCNAGDHIDLPVIEIDSKVYTYSKAMKKLKGKHHGHRS